MIRVFREWFLDQLAMYAAYHTDRRNQLTHYVGVPIIIFSLVAALAQVPLGPSVSVAGVLLTALLLAYLAAVPAVGIVALLAVLPLYAAALYIAEADLAVRWGVIAASFVGGWAIQFIGHVFEGRKPAFLTNLMQVFMAPAFLVAEAMFAAGLQRDLSENLHARSRKYAKA